MDCTYTYNNEDVNNILELSKIYFKKVRQLSSDSAIYSSNEIRKSTVDILTNQQKFRTQYEANEEFVAVSDFIVSTSIAPILKSIGLNAERLNPEYIEENRIKEFVRDKMKSRNTSFDPTTIPAVSKNNLENLRKHKEFDILNDNELSFYLSQIESIIEFENKTKDFGSSMHKLISLSILEPKGMNSEKYNSFLINMINNNEEIFGKDLQKEWEFKINNIVQKINTMVLNTGHPITELLLMSDENDKARIKGRLDLVAVDDKGTAHIFDIKISKTPYSEWDSVKTITLDWQLALYRQLLSKHIDVTDTLLYVIPIHLGTLGDPNTLFYNGAENRKTILNSGLVEGGKITIIARLLVQNTIHLKYDEDRVRRLIEGDLAGLIPNYLIKTTNEEYNVDKIVARAVAKGDFSYFNRFPNNLEFPDTYIRAVNEVEFREKIERYVSFAKAQQHMNVIRLRDSLNSVFKDPSKTSIETGDKKTETNLNRAFKDYLNGGWEIVSMNEATSLGLIILRNINTGTIDVISLSIFNDLFESTDIDGLTYGELDILKAIMFLNEYSNELFIGKGSRIGNITTYNPQLGKPVYKSTKKMLDIFINRMTEIGRKSKIKLNPEIHVVSEIKMALNNVIDSQTSYEGKSKGVLEQIFSSWKNVDLDSIDAQKLNETRIAMLKAFPELGTKQLNPILNFSDPVEYLYTLLQIAILKKDGADLHGDVEGLTKYSLQFSDFKSLIAALYTKNQPEYNSEGVKVLGLMGGLMQSTPDFVRSNDLRNINLIIANVNSKIGQKMVEQSDRIHELTEKYYSDISWSGLSRSYIGESQSKFEDFFIKENGVVSKEFRTKNPYKSELNDSQSAYLKGILFEIQKYMLGLKSDEISKIDPNSLESLMGNTKIADAIKNGNYFKIPLVRREEFSRNKDLMAEGLHGFWKRFKSRLHEINDFIDPRELDPEDLKNIKESSVGFTEMYDIYAMQSDKYKDKVISKYGVNYFEFNLDTIAHRVAFNKIRKYQFDAKLPVITAYIWWLKLHGGKENAELTKVMKYIENQLKLAAFDEPIIDDEFKDVATVTAILKRITTAAMLAFRPILLIKEMTLGVMKGVGLAASQIYGKDQFTIKDLTASYTKLLTINDKFSNEFNLIDKLNHYYRFANMDINTLSKKIQTDRRGIMRGMGRWMYSMNTIPDYYNRLSLFLAKMIHDGSYDAHSLVNGKMIYDVTKDKRFEHYLKNRSKYKNSEGEYIPAKSDLEYNKQRNLYKLLVEQLNQEKSEDDKVLTEEDLVTKAYSEKERASFKSFTDMAYGYYDKDSQSQLNNTFFGMVWMQFLQFWPGKMRQWFGKPVKGENSPIGAFKQKTIIENGKEVLLWKKPKYSEENPDKIEWFDHVTENTGDPLMEWEGSPQEGFIYSILFTLQDVYKGATSGDFTDLKSNDARLRRVGYAMHDALLMFILMGLLKALLDGLIEENGTEGISGELLQFGEVASTKVLRETNIFQNTLGALSLEPLSLSYVKRLAKDMEGVMVGNKSVTDLFGSNVGMLEFWKERN